MFSVIRQLFKLQYKQSTDNSNNSEAKPNRKVSASQRLSNLRDRLNTVDVIPLQLPAVNNECVVCFIHNFIIKLIIILSEYNIL